jgi:hypothetical protein
MENIPPERSIQPAPTEANITWVVQPRVFRGYIVNEQELLILSSTYTSVNLFFLGPTFGAAISFPTALLTTTFASSFVFAAFCAVLFVSVVLSFYFGVAALRDQHRADDLVRQIRERS